MEDDHRAAGSKCISVRAVYFAYLVVSQSLYIVPLSTWVIFRAHERKVAVLKRSSPFSSIFVGRSQGS